MLVKPLLIQHLQNGKVIRSKMLRSARRPFVIGSSRLADLRISLRNVAGVHSVVEYRHPHWYLVNCDVEGEHKSEQRVYGGEVIDIDSHTVKLLLGEEHEDFFSKSKEEGNPNSHQVVVYSHSEVISTKFLPMKEAYVLDLGTVCKEFAAPTSNEWVETKIGRFTIKQRLTFKPNQLPSERPYLSLVNDKGIKNGIIGAFCFFVMILTLQMALQGEPEEKPENNRFVKMIYDAKVVKKMRENSQKIVKNNFTESVVKKIDTSPVPRKKLVTKVIKNIKKAGLTNLIAKIAKRASQNSLKIQAIGKTADDRNTARALASVGSSQNIAEKTNLTGKSYKLAKVKTSGKAGGNKNYKLGSSLNSSGIGSADVEVLEEETIIDGGLDKEVIAQYIKSKLGQIRYCYERQLSANPDLHGKVLVKFTIGGTGKVNAQSISKTSLKNANVEACILRRVAGWKFPTPKGGTSVIVSYPFLFKSIN